VFVRVRRDILIRLWILIGIPALPCNASGASSVEEQVKSLAQQYKQVEDQLARSVHYIRKTESGGAITVEQAWFNGGDDLIKVAVERTDASGRELTEYFTRDLDLDSEPMFVLTRRETPLPDGGTQVEESRKYFGENEHGNGQLIRELTKNARFKRGESTDTVHTPNVVVDRRRQPKDNRSDEERIRAESEFFDQPQKIASALKEAGPPDYNPFANVKGDSDKFRVIRGTASPDGRFAVALGFARDQVNWNDFFDKEFEEEGKTYYAENEEDIRNYVVDLAQQKILGETGCNYFGTRRRYNHRACIVTWSPDSMKFVQLWDDKWSSTACVAGKINLGPTFAGAVDVDKAIEKKTYAFVKERFDPEAGGSLSLHINKVGDDGTIDLDALEEIPSGERKGETEFAVNERLRLSDGPKGPRLEILKIRRLPND
jgi:hypothetical protein